MNVQNSVRDGREFLTERGFDHFEVNVVMDLIEDTKGWPKLDDTIGVITSSRGLQPLLELYFGLSGDPFVWPPKTQHCIGCSCEVEEIGDPFFDPLLLSPRGDRLGALQLPPRITHVCVNCSSKTEDNEAIEDCLVRTSQTYKGLMFRRGKYWS